MIKHIKHLSDINLTVEFAFNQMAENLIREYNSPEPSAEYRQLFATNPDIIKQLPVMRVLLNTNPEFRAAYEKIWVDIINQNRDEASNNNMMPDDMPVTNVENAIDNLFKMIRQGQLTNGLTKFNARKRDNLTPDPISGTLKITNKDGDFTVEIRNFPQTEGLRTSALQFLDAITQELTRSGAKSNNIRLSLSDYMNMRGLKDEKEARKQAKADLEILYNLSVHYEEKRKGKRAGSFIDVRLIYRKGVIENSIICVTLTPDFFEILKNYNIMPYPQSLYRLRDNNTPNSYYFLRKITEHKNMNYFKPNADIISVETLLNSSPVMPSYDEVSKSDRHYQSRIITPFENDMNALDETFTWEYCHENGEPLTDEELANFNYDIFITLLVKITWRFYPERTKPKRKRQPKPKSLAPIAL